MNPLLAHARRAFALKFWGRNPKVLNHCVRGCPLFSASRCRDRGRASRAFIQLVEMRRRFFGHSGGVRAAWYAFARGAKPLVLVAPTTSRRTRRHEYACLRARAATICCGGGAIWRRRATRSCAHGLGALTSSRDACCVFRLGGRSADRGRAQEAYLGCQSVGGGKRRAPAARVPAARQGATGCSCVLATPWKRRALDARRSLQPPNESAHCPEIVGGAAGRGAVRARSARRVGGALSARAVRAAMRARSSRAGLMPRLSSTAEGV